MRGGEVYPHGTTPSGAEKAWLRKARGEDGKFSMYNDSMQIAALTHDEERTHADESEKTVTLTHSKERMPPNVSRNVPMSE